MTSQEVKEFLGGSLVTWFVSCLEDPRSFSTFGDLVDGVLLYNVYLQIDPEPAFDGIVPSDGDPKIRTRNLEIVLENIKLFYEKQLDYVVIKTPDIYKLGKDPENNVHEIKLILLLLLGCAVQCSSKEGFITRIKALDVDTQLAIVDCIKQVTDHQNIVLSREVLENLNLGGVYGEIKRLTSEKSLYRKKWKNLESMVSASLNSFLPPIEDSEAVYDESVVLDLLLTVAAGEKLDPKQASLKGKVVPNSALALKLERLLQYYVCASSAGGKLGPRGSNSGNKEDFHRHVVELADWKSRVRKQRQELEEKTEGLIECREELKYCKGIMTKLKEENQELMIKARVAETLRDELDAAVERAEKADRLESEVARYREKLTDIEYYKSRIDELREDNKVLLETREMLEEQLQLSREKAEKVLELESEIVKYEKLFNDMALEKTSEESKYQKVCDENSQLHSLIKTMASELAGNNSFFKGSITEMEDDSFADKLFGSGDNRLSEQLSNNAQTRALKLELENRRLATLIDSLKEKSSHEYSFQVLELEKDKKKLSLKVESLNELVERLNCQNSDFENLYKQSIEDSKKLQCCLATQQTVVDKLQQDLQIRNEKLANLEKAYDSLTKDLESATRRADEFERNLFTRDRQLSESKLQLEISSNEFSTKLSELESRLCHVEKERDCAQKEIQKLRKSLEEKDFTIDEITNADEVLGKKILKLTQENNNLAAQISRLRDFERSSRELSSQVAIDREALENLQHSLTTEKNNLQHINIFLSKFGLNSEGLKNLSVDEIIEIINRTSASEPENLKALIFEKNKLQVYITKIESEKSSLTSQLASTRLAYSRLEENIKELLTKYSSLQANYQELAKDTSKLQFLHDQLSIEYEKQSAEKDALKLSVRDAKNETRLLREASDKLENKSQGLQSERDELLQQAKALTNLRGEHSKLKEDFRNLFSNTEVLKIQYKNLQEEYKQNKLDMNKTNFKQAEMQKEINIRDDRCIALEQQVSKLSERCEMLIQMNSSLDNDRRALMDHVSLLLKQYHELLTHSLEDKEHHHMEEKTYSEKVNNLCRQKEKLEEKIMEHYKKLDSCSSKSKRGLGATIVRRVRKASSGLFTKNVCRRSWSQMGDNSMMKSSFEKNDEDDEEDDILEHDEVSSNNVINFKSESIETTEDDFIGPLTMAHAGTRRTVYYMDSSSSSSCARFPALAPKNTEGEEMTEEQMTTNKIPQSESGSQTNNETNQQRPLLVFNKITTVINENSGNTTPGKDGQKDLDSFLSEDNDQKMCKPKNSIWYEYGCV